MTGLAWIVFGLVMIMLGFGFWIVSVFAEASGQQASAETVKTKTEKQSIPAMQATIIDVDGTILVPQGVPVWDDREWSYRIWDDACNNGRFASVNGYRWFQLDKVGTPVTDEEMQQIDWHRYGGQP